MGVTLVMLVKQEEVGVVTPARDQMQKKKSSDIML
jgi:hypothetical protein